MKFCTIAIVLLVLVISVDAFNSPVMMCSPTSKGKASSDNVSRKPDETVEGKGMSRRESLMSFMKGGAAVVL
eukprot:267193-Rhodomonas_salina.1